MGWARKNLGVELNPITVIESAGRKIDDEILQPVKNTVEAIVEDPKKLAAVALAVAFPGAGAFLGAQLGITSAALAQVVGQTIINTALNGGDVKAAVIAAAIPVVGKEASGLIGETLAKSGVDAAVNKVVTDVATRGLTAAALGQDPLAAMTLGGINAGVSAIAGSIPDFKDLPASAQSTIQNAIATQLAGGDVSQSLVSSAIDFAKKEVASYRAGSQNNTLTDADVAAISGGDAGGTYTGVNLAGPGEGTNTGTFVPSWVSLASDERIVGTGRDDEGQPTYHVERINPNNPEQFMTYSVSRDAETGKIYYGTDFVDASGNVTIKSAQKKPTVDWDAEEGAPTSLPEKEPTDATPPVDDFIDSLVRDDALFGDKPNPTIDDLVKDLGSTQQPPGASPVTPPVTSPATSPTTPPTANVTPQEVEKIVNDALKANPNLAEEDVQRIVSDAVSAIPNLTAEQVRQIVGSELTKLPVSATPADVQTAVDVAQAASNAQYNALTAAQKAEADARVAQGQSLQDAITGVAGQVTGLEGQLTQQGKDFAAQLMQQGMDYTTAMQTAISAQSALFGTQLGGVQAEIAANEARRIADQQAAAAAADTPSE
jgi:hypothetical protein